MNLQELQRKEAYLLSFLERLRLDLNEFTKYPCETVDLMQIKYQYSLELRNLKEVQRKIILLQNHQRPLVKLEPEFIAFLQQPKTIKK